MSIPSHFGLKNLFSPGDLIDQEPTLRINTFHPIKAPVFCVLLRNVGLLNMVEHASFWALKPLQPAPPSLDSDWMEKPNAQEVY